jgi:hypothetical protein
MSVAREVLGNFFLMCLNKTHITVRISTCYLIIFLSKMT